MGSDEPLEGRCGAKRRGADGYCRRYPAVDDDGNAINGRCLFHGGHEDIGAPEGNANPWKHGATANRERLEEHLDAEDLAWVEDLADRYRRLAGIEEDDPRADVIMDVSLASFQRAAARSTAISEDLKHTDVVGTNAEGYPVRNETEHYLGPAADRISREIRQNLDKLGILSGDEDTIPTKSAAQIIAHAVESKGGASEDENLDPPSDEDDAPADPDVETPPSSVDDPR